MSRNERTGWRDIPLIEWHKARHVSCRAAGIQFLMLEYNLCQKEETCTAIAVIDYRRYEDGVPNTEHSIYRAVRDICDKATIPFFLCYHDQHWGFYISPQNREARRKAPPGLLVTEQEFVDWLHRIRGGMPQEDVSELRTIRPNAPPNLPMSVPQLASLDDGTLWRGQELSARHRGWGVNVAAVDLDFLLVDNNDATPIALIDFKFGSWQVDASIRAQKCFARKGGIPFRIVRYERDPWTFQVVFPKMEEKQTETEWLSRLVERRSSRN